MNFNQPVVAYTPDQMIGEYDILFLMTKQQHNAEVVQMLKGFLASDGVLVTFQNGLPEMQIADVLGEERVLGCTVAWGQRCNHQVYANSPANRMPSRSHWVPYRKRRANTLPR